eukprot:NODE_4433_length_1168_cov_79.523445_g3918_i0.p1 GENE.NODE_4433_length_1168_cov_79.523445_g3918_i0~~NODE_4433_length_1168_cov_79.523445_g3918_i0.p1  ORF type:complete len:347 (-),score=39.65 NODE_4433_length_1168_cov_79.523445_g3918_i0:128-1105(-)
MSGDLDIGKVHEHTPEFCKSTMIEILKQSPELKDNQDYGKMLIQHLSHVAHQLGRTLHAKAIVEAIQIQCGEDSVLFKTIRSSKDVGMLVEDYNLAIKISETIASAKSWPILGSEGVVNVHYNNKAVGTQDLYVYAALDGVNPLNLMAVVYEVDLYHKWFPLIKTTLLKEPMLFRKLVDVELFLPWPLSTRALCVSGSGLDMMQQDKSVIVMIREAKPDDAPDNFVMPKHSTQFALPVAGYRLNMKSPNDCVLEMVFNCDLKLSAIPSWLQNWVARQFCSFLASRLVATAKNIGKTPDCPYAPRIKSKPVYDYFNKSFEQYSKEL